MSAFFRGSGQEFDCIQETNELKYIFTIRNSSEKKGGENPIRPWHFVKFTNDKFVNGNVNSIQSIVQKRILRCPAPAHARSKSLFSSLLTIPRRQRLSLSPHACAFLLDSLPISAHNERRSQCNLSISEPHISTSRPLPRDDSLSVWSLCDELTSTHPTPGVRQVFTQHAMPMS
jgi:hypothetical protein